MVAGPGVEVGVGVSVIVGVDVGSRVAAALSSVRKVAAVEASFSSVGSGE
jgi:hypothetical protein